MFTKTELAFIKSTIKLQGIANHIASKYGTCSRNYVSQVIKSDLPPDTKMANAIINYVQKFIKVFEEENNEE